MQASKQAGKKASRQASRQALRRHSVGAMPWRGLFFYLSQCSTLSTASISCFRFDNTATRESRQSLKPLSVLKNEEKNDRVMNFLQKNAKNNSKTDDKKLPEIFLEDQNWNDCR